MPETQHSPAFTDVAEALGRWIGEVLPGTDLALSQIGDGDWQPGTREAVLRAVGSELIDQFEDGVPLKTTAPDILEAEARQHLARFVIARSRSFAYRDPSSARA
jgi:hypothetical protein